MPPHVVIFFITIIAYGKSSVIRVLQPKLATKIFNNASTYQCKMWSLFEDPRLLEMGQHKHTLTCEAQCQYENKINARVVNLFNKSSSMLSAFIEKITINYLVVQNASEIEIQVSGHQRYNKNYILNNNTYKNAKIYLSSETYIVLSTISLYVCKNSNNSYTPKIVILSGDFIEPIIDYSVLLIIAISFITVLIYAYCKIVWADLICKRQSAQECILGKIDANSFYAEPGLIEISSNNECCICLDDIKQYHLIYKTKCEHIYHTKCVCEMVQKNINNCALCRAPL